MVSPSPNLMSISKYIISLAVITTIAVTLIVSHPVIHGSSSNIIIAPKRREIKEEQVRLFELNEIVRENLHDLPPRSRNMSAKDMCKKSYTCAPQSRRYETMLRVSPKYKMVQCVVQKSMSTMMTGTMCYLYNEKRYVESGRSFDDEFNSRFCKDRNEFNSVNGVRDAYKISVVNTDWSFSMITRDPIDRFVSGYVDRCVRIHQKNTTDQCNGCGLNITCFIEREYKRLMEISYKRKTHRTMEDAHFFPQVWHCDLNEEMENFEFIQYSGNPETSLIPQLADLLKRQNVPSTSIEFIKNELTNKRTSHSTSGTPAKRFYMTRLMKSPYLLEFLVKMFYHDFVKFHYDFPPGF